MSRISDWFGASSYGNVFGTGMTASTTVSDALGSGLANGALILDFGPDSYMNGGATLYNLSQDSYQVAKYSNDKLFAFYHEYQQGKVYYTAGASSPWYYSNQTAYNNFSKLLVAAMKWVANVGNGSHTVSTPNTSTGPSSGNTGQSLNYSTGGSSCNQGHNVEYRFDWGDGNSYSSWGASSRSHSFSAAGIYNIKAQARCTVDNSVVSNWSNGKSVTINVSPSGEDYIVSVDAIWDNDPNTNSSNPWANIGYIVGAPDGNYAYTNHPPGGNGNPTAILDFEQTKSATGLKFWLADPYGTQTNLHVFISENAEGPWQHVGEPQNTGEQILTFTKTNVRYIKLAHGQTTPIQEDGIDAIQLLVRTEVNQNQKKYQITKGYFLLQNYPNHNDFLCITQSKQYSTTNI